MQIRQPQPKPKQGSCPPAHGPFVYVDQREKHQNHLVSPDSYQLHNHRGNRPQIGFSSGLSRTHGPATSVASEDDRSYHYNHTTSPMARLNDPPPPAGESLESRMDPASFAYIVKLYTDRENAVKRRFVRQNRELAKYVGGSPLLTRPECQTDLATTIDTIQRNPFESAPSKPNSRVSSQKTSPFAPASSPLRASSKPAAAKASLGTSRPSSWRKFMNSAV
jgi:hypothetical protein